VLKNALEDRKVFVTSMHNIKSVPMFEDDATSPEHAVVMQGGSLGGLGW
jgi:hypothetical protein